MRLLGPCLVFIRSTALPQRTEKGSLDDALESNQVESIRSYERGVRVTRGSDRGSAVAYRGVSAPVNARFFSELAPYGRASREENDCRGFATLAPPPSTDRVTLPT